MTGGRDASGGRHGGAPLVCVVANPSKPSVTERTRRRITAMISAAGCRDPLWLETTPAETGATQARLAVASGADLVLAMGGDGTVRAVAAGLAGTGVELGILAAGTANLAARNLGLPVGGLDAALEAALSTPAAPTDLAWVRPLPDSEDSADAANADATASGGAGGPSPGTALEAVPGAATRTTTDPAPAPPAAPAPAWRATGIFGARPPAVAPVAPDGGAAGGMTGRAPLTAPGSNGWARPTLGAEHACLVVAGIGFDAGLVAATSPALKARLTWGAYALAAMSKLRSPRLALSVSIDGAPPEQLTARTLLMANGGRLPAGIVLLRGARLDDGVLDVAAIDVVGGLVGWTDLARQILPPFAATYSDPARSLGRVTLRQGTEVVVRAEQPALVQVDGELLAPTRGLRIRLQHGAVLVRRPDQPA